MLKVEKLDIKNNPLNILIYHTEVYGEEVRLSYKGPINRRFITSFSNEIRFIFQEEIIVNRKLFAIFIELAQNLLFYSVETNCWRDKEKVGTIVITEVNDTYKVYTGNLIEKTKTKQIVDSCEFLNSLTRDELRQQRIKIADSEPKTEDSQGAGIGLIKVALTSTKPIKTEVKEMNEIFDFLILSTNVDKA